MLIIDNRKMQYNARIISMHIDFRQMMAWHPARQCVCLRHDIASWGEGKLQLLHSELFDIHSSDPLRAPASPRLSTMI